MEGMLKTAPSETAVVEAPQTTKPLDVVRIDGVPVEFISHFNLDMRVLDNKDNKQLSDIYEFIQDGTKDMGDVLQEIRRVEMKLGAPSYSESRYSKIWQYLKLNKHISNLFKEREAMARG